MALVTIETMKCCGSSPSSKANWSHYSSISGTILEKKISHFYCQKCGAHYFKGKNYTAEEWFFYINGVTYAEHQRREKES